MLLPPAEAATITKPQGGVYPCSPKGGLTLGSSLWGYHYHLRRQGGGTHHHPRRIYQGEEEMQASNRWRGTSILRHWLRNVKTGSYNVRPGHNRGRASDSARHQPHQCHKPFVIPELCSQCPTFLSLLRDAWGTTTCHPDPHSRSILLHQPRNECIPGPNVGVHRRPKGYKGAQPSVHAHNKDLGVVFWQRGDQLRSLRGPLCHQGKPWHPVDAGCGRGYLWGHTGTTPARHPQGPCGPATQTGDGNHTT